MLKIAPDRRRDFDPDVAEHTPQEATRSVFSPSLERLPFFDRNSIAWQDRKRGGDYDRGRGYAIDAIVAVCGDAASPTSLEHLVDQVIDCGFKRRGDGGRLCRRLTLVEQGFLSEIVRCAVFGAQGKWLTL